MKTLGILSVVVFLLIGAFGLIKPTPDKPMEVREYSSYVKFDDEQLFSYADVVASGKVVSVSQPEELSIEIGGEQKPMIYKDYTLEISEAFKGSDQVGTQYVIRVPGGELGKKKYISEAVAPEIGKEQVLFLKRWNYGNSTDETYIILGGSQGKYLIDGNQVLNPEKSGELVAFKERLHQFRNKYGDKVVLPPGFLR